MTAVQAERARLYELFMHAPAIVCVVRGPRHVFELANPMYLRLIGRRPEDVIGRPAREALPELENQGYWEILDRVYATGDPFVGKEMLSRLDRRGDGTLEDVYLNFVYQPLRDVSGRVDGIMAHAVDVTDEVRARQEVERLAARVTEERDRLRLSEKRFRAFVTASSDVVYRMSADWSEMYHLQGKDFIADTTDPSRTWLQKYIHPEDQVQVLAAIQKAIRTKSVFELEHRVIRVDGTLGWTYSRAIPLLDEKGGIVEWFGAARDVTDRRRAEEALAAERRLYYTILSNTPDLVFVFGLDHRFTYANEALLKMWGKAWSEAIGKTCLELGYPDWHAAMHDREIEQVKATKKPVRGEVPFTGTHGRRIYDYIFVPVLGAKGEVEAVAGTTRDVTELRARAEMLEAMVAERTASLSAANKELEAFSYSVSHDLRAPLRSIIGFARLLAQKRGDALGPEGRELLDRVLSAGERMRNIIEGLLRLSKANQGELKAESVDLTGAAVKVIAELREASPRRSVETVVQPGLMAQGDSEMLRIVLQNLIENAWKFTSRTPEARIEIGSLARKDRTVYFVRDNGVGFDMGDAKRLFSAFHRLHSASDFPGTGIGLATAHRVIERHGGELWAESRSGHGAAFYFTLQGPSSPLRRPAQDQGHC